MDMNWSKLHGTSFGREKNTTMACEMARIRFLCEECMNKLEYEEADGRFRWMCTRVVIFKIGFYSQDRRIAALNSRSRRLHYGSLLRVRHVDVYGMCDAMRSMHTPQSNKTSKLFISRTQTAIPNRETELTQHTASPNCIPASLSAKITTDSIGIWWQHLN